MRMRKKWLLLLIPAVLAGIFLTEGRPREPLPEQPPEPAATCPQTRPLPEETEPFSFDRVPVYYQTDYPYIRYGDGTIGSSGCSMACLAMAASYVTDQVFTPDMLVYAFGGYGENNVQRLNHAIEELGLPCQKDADWRQTQRALEEGKIAIALMDERSEFTTSSHFILLTGINEAGRYEVIDPFEPNYRENYLAEGFRRGFTGGQIVAGLEGCWLFDKAAVPADYYYNIEMPDYPETRYTGFRAEGKDIYYLACFLWAAAREEEPQTQQAVAELVLNRMVSPKYPDRVEDVMRQEELYVWGKQLDRAQPGMEQYMAVTAAISGPYVLPIDVVHGAPWPVGGGEEWGKLGSFVFSYE